MTGPVSSARVRSKTGCLTCKKRRKKCDETRPTCQRCTKAGMECLGYSYLECSKDKATRKRSQAASRAAAKSGSTPPTNPISVPTPTQSPAVHSEPRTMPSLAPTFSSNPLLPIIPGVPRENMPSHGHTKAAAPADTCSPSELERIMDFSVFSSSDSDMSFNTQLSAWDPHFASGIGSSSSIQPWTDLGNTGSITSRQDAAWQLPGVSNVRPLTVEPRVVLDPPSNPPLPMTTGQASLYNALFSLGDPATEPSVTSSATSQPYYTTPASSRGSTWPSPDTERDDEDSETSEDSDPEGIKEIICGTPTLDPTAQSNSLPFILQNYASWITRSVYEPLRLAHKVKHWVTLRYNESNDSRTSITMMANLLSLMWKRGVGTTEYIPLVSQIRERVMRRIAEANSKPPRVNTASEMDALVALDESMELIVVQCLTSPLSSTITLLSASAPLFRRACPGSTHEPISLPLVFLHPELHLRQFAALDITISTVTGRPMLFRYEVRYSRDMCNGAMVIGEVGLQWLNGIPDQILLLLARMNVLRDDFSSNLDPLVVGEIEQELLEFSPLPGASSDAYLLVARLAVQECWRLATYVYLYMGLCGASAADPRVVKHHKNFIRLLERTKPGRTPDAFLIIPMILAGIASQRPRDRNFIYQRLLSLQECAHPGTSGNDALRMLEAVWARSNIELRPATWADMKVAFDMLLQT